MPNIVSGVSKEKQQQLIRDKQAKDPAWKRAMRDAVDIPANLMKGFLGSDPDPNESNAGYLANVLTQFGGALEPFGKAAAVKAGLPFLAVTKGKPVYHGARNAFEKFDYGKLDTGDILGSMVHFAEDPEYANEFAHGAIKTYGGGNKPNVIPAHVDAKNVLDLTDKGDNFDDFSQALAALNPIDRKRAIQDFKIYNKEGGGGAYDLKRRLSTAFNEPETFKRTPFDAIRYDDIGGHKSIAVPEHTPIKTPYGAPLNDAAERKPLQIIKGHSSGEGFLESTENFVRPEDRVLTSMKNKYSNVNYSTAKDKINTVSHGKPGGSPNEMLIAGEWHKFHNFSDLPEDVVNKLTKTQIDNLYYTNHISPTKHNILQAQLLENQKSMKPGPNAKKIEIKPEKYAKHPIFGNLSEQEAKDLVKGGELPMSTYMKMFGHEFYER